LTPIDEVACFVGLGRVFDKALFTARFARDAEGAEKIYIFFLVRGQKRKDLTA